MIRIRDFEGHFCPSFFLRRYHPFHSFHNQKLEQLYHKKTYIAIALERFAEPELIPSLVL